MFIFYVFCAFLRDFRAVNIFTGSVATSTFFTTFMPLLDSEIFIYLIIPEHATLGSEAAINWEVLIFHINPFLC